MYISILVTVEELYNGLVVKDMEKQAESMLQFLLDLISVQSQTALSIVVYAYAHLEPSDFEVAKTLFLLDINDIIEKQFNDENQKLGIRAIFDKR